MSAIEGQKSQRTPLGTAGLVLIFLGIAVSLMGLALYLFAFPDRWYAIGDITFETSKMWVEFIVLTTWAGVMLLLLGVSMFFYGRTYEGAGKAHDRHQVDIVEGA